MGQKQTPIAVVEAVAGLGGCIFGIFSRAAELFQEEQEQKRLLRELEAQKQLETTKEP